LLRHFVFGTRLYLPVTTLPENVCGLLAHRLVRQTPIPLRRDDRGVAENFLKGRQATTRLQPAASAGVVS
jgi:hypothetical protein